MHIGMEKSCAALKEGDSRKNQERESTCKKIAMLLYKNFIIIEAFFVYRFTKPTRNRPARFCYEIIEQLGGKIISE